MGQPRIQNSSDYTLRKDVTSSNTSAVVMLDINGCTICSALGAPISFGLANSESLHDDDKSQDMRRSSANAGTIRKTSCMSLISLKLKDESLRSPRKQVSFSNVEIQTYAIELGDHPSTAGVPITIGWKPQFKIVCDIDEYERLRPPSRHGESLSISSGLRVDMLHKQGTSMRDMMKVKRESQKIRRAREKSVQSVMWDGLNEALESASRTVKRWSLPRER
jgi:hypothetical protein